MTNIDGIKYLLINNPNLCNKIKIRNKKQMNKYQIIENYLQKLEDIESKCKMKKNYLYAYKALISNRHITQFKDVPQSYYKNQEKMYLDRGFGFIELDESIKFNIYAHIQKEQISSLNKWLNYLIYNENKYPEWFLYLCLESITKIGKVDYKNFTFTKRNQTKNQPQTNPKKTSKRY